VIDVNSSRKQFYIFASNHTQILSLGLQFVLTSEKWRCHLKNKKAENRRKKKRQKRLDKKIKDLKSKMADGVVYSKDHPCNQIVIRPPFSYGDCVLWKKGEYEAYYLQMNGKEPQEAKNENTRTRRKHRKSKNINLP
jgi:phage-related minor tail protein